MKFFQPSHRKEALEAKAAYPEAVPIFGGTDVMVELNFARSRPQAMLDLTCIPEIREWGAEGFIEGVLEERGLWESRTQIEEPALRRFGEVVAAAARPIDDVRGTAEYRRHSVGVLARRTLKWAWDEYREATDAA